MWAKMASTCLIFQTELYIIACDGYRTAFVLSVLSFLSRTCVILYFVRKQNARHMKAGAQ